MICNHCTMNRKRMLMYRTSNGYICALCREEITYATATVPEFFEFDDDENNGQTAGIDDGTPTPST